MQDGNKIRTNGNPARTRRAGNKGDAKRPFRDKTPQSPQQISANLLGQPPRWPTECQVIEDRIWHIPFLPPAPEGFYEPTGREFKPKPVGNHRGILVYEYYPMGTIKYFSRSSVGGSGSLMSTCPNPEENGLRFESRFESGNLARAVKITASYYELYLRKDLYTRKHMQWFYFRVTNMKKNFMYRFSIVNLFKDDSLYNEGMKPLLYSTKNSKTRSIGWKRCGENIAYYCNEIGLAEGSDEHSNYTLTFSVRFPHEGDVVYLAHSYPYTYSDLQDYLMEMSKHPTKSNYTTLNVLCKSLAGNDVYYVTITSPQECTDAVKKRKGVVLTARVHPGETPSSWMMKGMLDFLTGDSGSAKELRDRFVFKIVPMLNPDGVIVGNTRCSLSGHDLNRQYRTVFKERFPSIWFTKHMIKRLLKERGVAMYCDLHAHSRKHNIFMFGCENSENHSTKGPNKQLLEQVFPMMLHKNASDKFSFENCNFQTNKTKEGTGRIFVWMMGIANSYTMEASFGGSTIGQRNKTHFTIQDYQLMGRTFCQTLLDFYDEEAQKERLRIKIVDRLINEGWKANDLTSIQLSEYYTCEDSDSSSSSSDEGSARWGGKVTFLKSLPPSPKMHGKTKKHHLKKTKRH